MNAKLAKSGGWSTTPSQGCEGRCGYAQVRCSAWSALARAGGS